MFLSCICRPVLRSKCADLLAVVFKGAGRLAFHLLVFILSWPSVWEIQTCGPACVFLLRVHAGPFERNCAPASGCFQVCGPACVSSACDYLVVVIGMGNSHVQGGLCYCVASAGRSLGRNVRTGLQLFSEVRADLLHRLVFTLSWPLVWEIQTCGLACDFLLQVQARLFVRNVRGGLGYIGLRLSCRGHRYREFTRAGRLVFLFYKCRPVVRLKGAGRRAIVFKCAGWLGLHWLALIMSWSSV